MEHNIVSYKNLILIILMYLISFTLNISFVKAESCIDLTSDNKEIGDEIACGDEHFYIISNDGENVKMLAKYNLNVGYDMQIVDVLNSKLDFENIEEVRQLYLDGWWIYDSSSYSYDSETRMYNGSLIFVKSLFEEGTAIFFDTPKTAEEIYKDSEVMEYLEKGYKVSFDNYLISNPFSPRTYGGVRLVLSDLDYETIELDGTSIGFQEMYSNSKVRELLNSNYYIYDYSYESCSTDSPTLCDFDAVYLVKSKYNNYDYVSLFTDIEYDTFDELENYLKENTEYSKYLDDGYEIVYVYTTDGLYYSNYNPSGEIGILLKKYKLKYDDRVSQSEEAIGSHGESKEDPDWPARGVYFITSSDYHDDYDYYKYDNTRTYYNEGYADFTLVSDSNALKYLKIYKNNLNEDGYNVADIDLITVAELSTLIKNITESELPLEDYYNEFYNAYKNGELEYVGNFDFYNYVLDSIKDKISTELQDKYSWIWGTTYWTRTLGKASVYEGEPFLYYVDTLGELCAAGEGCNQPVPAGLRPVLTMSINDIDSLSNDIEEEIENPNTGRFISIIIMLLLGMSLVVLVKYFQRKQQVNRV